MNPEGVVRQQHVVDVDLPHRMVVTVELPGSQGGPERSVEPREPRTRLCESRVADDASCDTRKG